MWDLGMRVITGSAKGRRLASVPGQSTRPITDRVKEALFNILAGEVEDASVLDLFAGTGGVGIEALSRGARKVWFVDKEWKAIQTIKANLQITGFLPNAKVFRQDAFRLLRQAAGKAAFDIIYVAPPQYQGLWADALAEIDALDVLAPGGLVIAQIHPKEFQELQLKRLSLEDKRKYGSTVLCFYRADEITAPEGDAS
jgi:16S rRNA (guanine966-N2)-methyltransferase